HQLWDAADARGANALPPAEQHHAYEFHGVAFELVDEAAHLCDRRYQAFAHHGLEELFLVVEVEVERALGDTGPGRDIFQARSRVAARDEYFQRGGGDFFRARVLAARPAGFGFGGCRHGENKITDQSVI